jgi:hypothetical protein
MILSNKGHERKQMHETVLPTYVQRVEAETQQIIDNLRARDAQPLVPVPETTIPALSEARNTSTDAPLVIQNTGVEDSILAQNALVQKAMAGLLTQEEQKQIAIRLKVVTGKYSNEVPRLAHERKEAIQEKRELHAAMLPLQTEVNQLKRQIQSAGEPPDTTREAVVDYDPAFGDIYDKVDALTKRDAERNARQAQNQYLDRMNEFLEPHGIDAHTLNFDTGFQRFLEGTDIGQQYSREAILGQAYNQGDVQTGASYFIEYTGLQKPTMPAPPPPIEKPNPPVIANVQPAIGQQSYQDGNPADAKVWYMDEINTFYTDAAHKRLTDEDYKKGIASIDLANKEGRVRYRDAVPSNPSPDPTSFIGGYKKHFNIGGAG